MRSVLFIISSQVSTMLSLCWSRHAAVKKLCQVMLLESILLQKTSTHLETTTKLKDVLCGQRGLTVLQMIKKALSIVPKLLPRIVIIDKKCAMMGYASGKNKNSFMQYINNGMFALTMKDGNMVIVDGSDDNDKVLGAMPGEGMSMMSDDVLIATGRAKTAECLPLRQGGYGKVRFPMR